MLSSTFIARPRLAVVISIVITIAGLIALDAHSDRAVSRHRPAADQRAGELSWAQAQT